ncbi:hypothetical protein P7C71_g2060, partial [Lecanoromycetidae sp. Uapishka_2]
MNQMNIMAGFNPGNPALGNVPMANGGNNAAGRMAEDPADENTEHKLNTFIYSYLCNRGHYDAARALKNSNAQFDPLLENNDVNGDGNMQIDSKDGIDLQRPDDLPNPKNMPTDGQGGPFLLSWFSVFWDIFWAQRNQSRASNSAIGYVQHNQAQARIRQEQQQNMMQRMPMMPNGGMDPNLQQMMRFNNNMNPDLRHRVAMQNTNRNGIQATPQQMAQMQRQMQHQAQQQAMRRDPEMDMNGQRPRTPSASDHAPSPSKRQRMDGVQFNGQQMMPNGRGPPPGMPGQMMGGPGTAVNANQLLEMNGINPGNLSDSQFQSFQQQNPQVQQKSIQVYAQNLAKTQRQQSMSNAAGSMDDHGSPSFAPGLDGINQEFYNGQNPAAMQMRGAPPPNGANSGAGGNHALQDYQMQLMLLEQQNKKRLLMARQEQDTIGGNGRPNDGSGMQGPFAPGMSPSGSRGGPSPGPSDRKGGTPKLNQAGLPGSPMPDGSMRGSPAAMNFNQMNPDLYAQMNGNGMRPPPPSSHPGVYPNGQFNPQQMEAMARAQANGRMQPNNWQGAPNGQTPMQQPQPQQPPQIGTPQQRNEMPPPQAVPGAATNGRPGSPAVQPSPQPATKANPKAKKDTRERKKPAKKGSASVAATPASEAENAPPTPTPATPVTPKHQASFSKNDSQTQPNMMAGMAPNTSDTIAQPQADVNTMPPLGDFPGTDGENWSGFTDNMNNGDLLENFDFEQFLQSTDEGGFTFDPSTFEEPGGIEAGLGGP